MSPTGSRILVLGGTGFLGTALCRQLAHAGHDVTAAGSRDADLTHPDALHAAFPRPFDRIYHLAAWTQAGDFCLRHPGEQWVINQQINTNVLHWWQRRQPQARLTTIGTSCAYDPALPLSEENYFAGTPIDSLFTYAMTKRMLYVGQLALARQFGLRSRCFVPSTLYGPGYHTDGRQMHFIFDLVRKILRAKLYGEAVVLWGDGHQKRELVFVDDFVRLMLKLDAGDGLAVDLVNVGAGEEHSIRYFAGQICNAVGFDFSDIQFDAARYVGARSKCLDTAKLLSLLPGERLTPFDTGLRQTVDWFLDNRPAVLPPPG